METSATSESFLSGGGRAGRWLAGCLGLTLLALGLALVQQHSGYGVRVRLEIPKERLMPHESYFRWRLPEPYRTAVVERVGVLERDGLPWLNRSVSNKNLREFGAGWYYLGDGGVNLAPDDGLDPRKSPARLSVVVPYQFKPKVWRLAALLVLAQVLLLQWLRRGSGPPLPEGIRLRTRTWEVATLGMLGLALGAIALGWVTRRGFIDHAFVVRGLQESDAGGWYHLALGLMEGRGLTGIFENQRPFYSLFLAGLFTLFGEGLAMLRGFNALALLVAAGAAFTVGRLLGTAVTGLALVALLVGADWHLNYLHAALTENGGVLLAAVALLGAWQAAWTLSRRWAAVAGALNALATLTSGITLFTLPGYALLITFFPLWRRTPWRRALTLGVVYTVAASVVVGSWLVRQKVVHDRFTLSYNSAEVLAGGSDPVDGKLTVRVLQRAHAAGMDLSNADERYDTMIRIFKENVAADPGGYARRVLAEMAESLDYLPTDDPVVRTVLLLALLGFATGPWLRRGQWHALLLAAGLALLWDRHHWEVSGGLLAAAGYLLLRRSRPPAARLMALLLVVTVLAVMLLGGLVGNVATKRFWLVADWCVLAVVLAGARHGLVAVSCLITQGLQRCGLPVWFTGETQPEPAGPAALDCPRFIPVAQLATLLLACLCGGLVLAATLRGPRPPFPGLDVARAEAQAMEVLEVAQQRVPLLAEVPVAELTTRVVLDDGMTAAFAAGEGTQHWLPIYHRRGYERWVAMWRLADRQGDFTLLLPVLAPGAPPRLPRDQPVLVMGAHSEGRNRINGDPVKIFEPLWLVPLVAGAEGWQPDLAALAVFPPTPEALRAVAKGVPGSGPAAPGSEPAAGIAR